jgi:outer membrane immunogenic protein
MRSVCFGAIVMACSVLSAGAASAQNHNSWQGFYLGAHAGYAWGDADVTDTNGGVTPGPFGYSPKGAFGGGTAGYNWQSGNLVVGVEADLGYMDLSGAGRVPSSNPAAHQDITLDGGLYGVVAGRIGFAFGETLVYAKGGWAYLDGEAGQKTTNPGYVTNPTGAFSGHVYGGGLEHFVSRNVSIKAEYLHFDFGSENGNQTSVGDPPIGFVYTNKTNVVADTVKVGIAVHY